MLYGRAHRAAGLIRFFPRYASSAARPAKDMGLAGMIGVRQLYLALTLYGKVPDIVHIFRCYPIGWAATTGLLIVYYLLVRGSMDNGGTA